MFWEKFRLMEEATDGTESGGGGGEPGTEPTEGAEGGGAPSEGKKEEGKETPTEGTEKPPTEPYQIKELPKDSLLDKADLEWLNTLAKDRGLNKKEAEELLEKFEDLHGTRIEAQQRAAKETVAGWEKKAREEKGYKEDQALFEKGLEALDDKDGAFAKILKDSGYNYYAPLRKILINAGKAISDDTWVRGKGGHKEISDSQKTPGQIMYPNM